MAKRKSKTKQRVSDKAPADISEQFEQAFIAGLGALENARKAGTKTFETLVQQGEAYRKKTEAKTEALIDEVQGTIRELAGDAQSKATGLLEQVRETPQMEKLSNVFDARVDDAMKRLGMARKKDLNALSAKLDRILASIESKKAPAGRKKKTATKKRKPAKKAATRKTAKKAATRKTASKKAARKKPAKKRSSRAAKK